MTDGAVTPAGAEQVLIPVALGWRDGIESGAWPGQPDGQLREGVTIAVCTCARPQALERFLGSLSGTSSTDVEVLVVDSSPDDAAEDVTRRIAARADWKLPIRYLRVTGRLRGLTRQRNVALDHACHDLVAFFDDDIVLLEGCIAAMEHVMRSSAPAPVGVMAYLDNERAEPTSLWRLRRTLGLVSTLRPGAYSRSGMSVPWAFLAPSDEVVEGDWLAGGCTMWRTTVAREIRFNEGFTGYSNGEDLDFSLRAGSRGRLVLAGEAHALHLHAPGNRPAIGEHAYMGARNAWHIHRTALQGRTWRDGLYFHYAFIADTVLRAASLVRPANRGAQWAFVRGRLRFIRDLLGRRLAVT